MDNVLSIIALIFFCAAVISLAGGVTWSVVKLLPLKEKPKKTVAPPAET